MNENMKEKRFYLRIGNFMSLGDLRRYEEHWFETEDELHNYLDSIDIFGLDIFAVEVNKVIYNMWE